MHGKEVQEIRLRRGLCMSQAAVNPKMTKNIPLKKERTAYIDSLFSLSREVHENMLHSR